MHLANLVLRFALELTALGMVVVRSGSIRGTLEMMEDPADGAREQDGGYEPEAPTAIGAFEHVDVEPAPHELSPGAIVRIDDLLRNACG